MVKILQFNNSNKKYNFDDVSKETCILICNTIKIGKDKVKNPLTNNRINYNSPIVKQLLQLCYTKYNMKKRVKDIVDIDVLFDKKTLIKLKSGGGFGSFVSSVATKCNEYMFGMSYNKIYEKVELLGATSIETEQFTQLLTEHLQCFKINNIELFINFVKSCNNIKSKSNITFDELILHIDCIVKLFSLFDMKSIENIVFYDDSFITAYNEFISEYNNMKVTRYKDLLEPHNGIIQSNSEKFQDMLLIQLKTLNNKLKVYNQHVFQYLINTIYYEIFIKIYLCKDYHNKSIKELQYLVFSTNKYLPKYFSYIGTIDNKLNYIIAFLNHFSKSISSNIVIENLVYIPSIYETFSDDITKEIRRNIIKNKSLLIESYGENENLLSILYDNKKTRSIYDPYIYINNFKGTYYTSVIDKYVLLYKKHHFQYFNMTIDKISVIEKNYKNFLKHPFSTNVNKTLSLLSRGYSFVLDITVKDRINKIFTSIINSSHKESIEQILYVFHGTNSLLSNGLQDELVLTSLLSTSLNINTAIDFGYYIYVFRLKSNTIPYINFNDTFSEILHEIVFLPGSKITILNTFKILNLYEVILCDIENPLDSMYYEKLLTQIHTIENLLKYEYKENLAKVSLKTFDINIDTDEKRKNQNAIDVSYKYKTSDFTCYNLFIEAYGENALRFSFCNLKYTIHQMIINYIYWKINSDNVVKYNLMNCKNGEILICYNNKNSVTNKYSDKYNFNLLIADLLCGANLIDRYSNNSDYICKDNIFMRSKFKATGLYDGNGIQTISKEHYDNNKRIINLFNTYIKDFCSSDKLYKNIKPEEFEEIKSKITQDVEKLNFDLTEIIQDIKNLRDEFKINDIESIELKDLIYTINKYFKLRKTFIIKNIGKIIDLIKNKLQSNGGESMHRVKKDVRYKPYTRYIPQKTTTIPKAIKSINNNVKYTLDGYEIAEKGYSSTTTMSVKAFNTIQKRYNDKTTMQISPSKSTSSSMKVSTPISSSSSNSSGSSNPSSYSKSSMSLSPISSDPMDS